jgi:hypothetical protein
VLISARAWLAIWNCRALPPALTRRGRQRAKRTQELPESACENPRNAGSPRREWTSPWPTGGREGPSASHIESCVHALSTWGFSRLHKFAPSFTAAAAARHSRFAIQQGADQPTPRRTELRNGAPPGFFKCGASWTAVALCLPPKVELFGWA